MPHHDMLPSELAPVDSIASVAVVWDAINVAL